MSQILLVPAPEGQHNEGLLGDLLAIQALILAIQALILAIQQTIFVGSRKWLYFCIVFQDGGWDWTPQPRAWKMD